MVEKALIRYLRAISEPKYFSQRNFRPFPTLIFLGGMKKNEGSFASEVTVNLATGMESLAGGKQFQWNCPSSGLANNEQA